MRKILRAGQLAAIAAATCVTPLAISQQVAALPVTDSVKKPVTADVIPWALPRSLDRDGAFHPGNNLVTPALDLTSVLADDTEDGGPLRMGVVQEIESSDMSAGQWTELDDGGWLYTLWVHAEGAHAIRLRISDWNPPAAAELIIYSPDAPDYALGPITRDWLPKPGELWTPTVFDDDVFVEYYLPAHIDHLLPESQLVIDGLLNQYRALGDAEIETELNCHLDVACSSQWLFSAAGVGITSFVGGADLPGGFYCTAAMLTRTNGDFTPLLMTANHCSQASTNAANLEVIWNYQSPSCGGALPDPNSLPRARAVALLFNDQPTDWTMVGLLQGNTGGVTFLGYDPNAWADNSTATSVHHPDRSHKRISFGAKISNTGFAVSADLLSCVAGTSFFVRYPTGFGLTEPGSSGSPIFDAAQRVRGVQSCGSAPTCGDINEAHYGRLDVIYPVAQAYLNPVDPVFVNRFYNGFERGTAGQPMNRFVEGVYAVQRTRNLFIQAGSYNERLTIEKAMTLNASGGMVTIGQ